MSKIKYKGPTLVPTAISGLFKRPATRVYPVEIREPFANARGAISNDESSCILCGMCARVCPSGCIEVSKKDALWAHDPFACVLCGVCVEVCPVKSMSQSEHRPTVLVTRGRTELHPEPPKPKKKAAPKEEA